MIIQGDHLEFLQHCKHYRCMIADVPDNIGLAYDTHKDRMSHRDYQNWMEVLLVRAMRKCDIFWLTYNYTHDLWMKRLMDYVLTAHYPSRLYRQVIWHYTFGQYNDNELTNCYRPIARFHKLDANLNFDAIRVASERMKIGDSRAAGPRVPGDVWEFPRVQGNNSERRAWHPTQIPEGLIERMLLLSCTETHNGVTSVIGEAADLCFGTGTTGRVCQRVGIPFTGVELSEGYAKKAALELNVQLLTINDWLYALPCQGSA